MSGNKEEIVKQLAASFGMHVDKRNEKTHYDAATGTLYCEGNAIAKHTIDKALAHYTSQKNSLKNLYVKNSELQDQYLFSVVACNAIMLLQENVTK